MLQFEDFLQEIAPVNEEEVLMEMDEKGLGRNDETRFSQSIHGEGPALGNSKVMAKET